MGDWWRMETPGAQNRNQRPTPAKGTTNIYSLRGVLAPLQLYTKPSPRAIFLAAASQLLFRPW